MYRTHTCGELRKEHADKTVTLAGWVETLRISGKIGFLLLRDRYGITQCFLGKDLVEKFKDTRRESVVQVTGLVKARPENQRKADMITGDVELSATDLVVLSEANPLPLELDESIATAEETRLKYRYLDLRKPRMQKNLMLRNTINKAIREFLYSKGFLELETPMLAKSTPEGARDYLVPSRINKGSFYALPQSPQLFKQLFMIAGYDKYFQIVRCFRDEDLRADRQPEFTQLDFEMSFVKEEDVRSVIEELVAYVFKQTLDVELNIPFRQTTYKDAVEKYKTDRPDLREETGEKYAFTWVVDFPMFEKDDEGNITYTHHPFTMPKFTDISDITEKPLTLGGSGYDLVLNGSEIAGGSIRIHRRDIQEAVFEALGMSREQYEEKFGFFLGALGYGTPPHGGIAFGLDRLAAIMAEEASIREVIAFPKTKDAEDLMLAAPSSVDAKQLTDIGLAIKK